MDETGIPPCLAAMTALPGNRVRQSATPLIDPTPPCDAAAPAARAIALLTPASPAPEAEQPALGRIQNAA